MLSLGKNVILFNRNFNSAAVDFIYNSFKELEAAEEQEVVIMINSPGGELKALKSILDMIYITPMQVTTVSSGLAASCGFCLLMAGDVRLSFKDASLMSHQFSSGSQGKFHELEADSAQHKKVHKFMLEHYKLHTGLSEKEIEEKLLPATDKWITPQEAFKLNVIDGIVEPRIKPIGLAAREKVNKQLMKRSLDEAQRIIAAHKTAESE